MYANNLGFAGLYTFPNPLANVPVGSALEADNLVANKDGVAETRRGFAGAGTNLGLATGQYVDQFFAYQNRLLIHDTTGLLRYDSTGNLVWVTDSGTYTVPSGANKIRGVEANKNFYLATSDGVQKLDAYNSTPVLSGVPPGLDGTGTLAGAGSGFLGTNEQCAYQIVFGYTDINGNLNLGNPSERILVVNATGGADNVALVFTVPQGLTTNYFYQIYRTPQTVYSATPSANVPPGAEPQLAAQFNLTAPQIAALSVSYTDITPDSLLGAALYTNPSQQGALQTNDRPPLCLDMTLFSQMMFYANCKTLQSTTFNLISVGSPNGLVNNDTITVNGIVFTGKASQNNASKQFKVDAGGTVAENIDNTARNLIQCINANASTTNVYAIYLSGYNDLPGLIELQGVGFSVAQFFVTSSRGGAFSPTLPSSGTTFASSNDNVPNGVYISKVGQPEAVPLVNLLFVGGGDQPILRILPLRDRVIVLKSDGIFVITGTTPQNLSVTLLDSTIICIGPESAKLLNNSVYSMSNQGVVSITESGVTIQSRAIEQDLLSLTSTAFSNFTTCCHAISYESERLYILSMPSATTDTYGTQAWCYNWVTNAWTRWPLDIAAGLVNPFDNRLYLSRPAANNDFVYQERKGYTYADYVDDKFPLTIVSVDTTGLIVTLNDNPSPEIVGLFLDQDNVGIAEIVDSDFTAKTITLDLTNSTTPGVILPWVAGAAWSDVPIQVGLTYCPISAGFPHYIKDWGRINFWFNTSNFNFLTVIFNASSVSRSQDLQMLTTGTFGIGPFGPNPFGTGVGSPQCLTTLVPSEVSKEGWISPALSQTFPQTRFTCLGVTGSYEIVSDVHG